MLKMTGIELELIADIDIHLFFEKRMRGGIFYIAKRYSKADNKYMKSYDVNKLSKFITYLDANNLYGWEMSQYFPYGGFEWLSKEEIKNFDVNSIGTNSFDGYILEVHHEYRDELHDVHNNYPLAPETS